MAVEIRELVIRATVTEDSKNCCDDCEEGGGGENTEEIVNACVEKVLRVLKRAKDR